MLKVAAVALAALVATTAYAMRPQPDFIPMGNVIDMRGEIGSPDLRPAAASPAITTDDANVPQTDLAAARQSILSPPIRLIAEMGCLLDGRVLINAQIGCLL